MNLKELLEKPQRFTSGHRACRGCPMALIVRQVLRATDQPLVVVCATGCLEVTSTIYPETAWQVSWLHNAFENAAPTMSGIVSAYNFLKKSKNLPEICFVVFAGDGSTYDIGLQALSGAWEREDKFVYVCYDNGAYMNTGVQRSSATPFGAATKTTPVGKVLKGKMEQRKDIVKIASAHRISYIAQTAVHAWQDLYQKAKKAFLTDGPSFLNILSPCVLGWRYQPSLTIKLSRLATETCFWPLFEIKEGRYKLNYQPKEKLPLEEFLKLQGRFVHLLKPENKDLLDELQKQVDQDWQELLKLSS